MDKERREVDARPSVFVAQPCLGMVRVEHLLNITTWFLSGKYRLSYNPGVGNIPHDRARNILIADFLKTDYDYIFFTDARTVGYIDTLDKLLAADKPVISATAQTFKNAYDGSRILVPTSFVWNEDMTGYVYHYGKDIEEVDVTHLACTLIKREVIETMARPWVAFEFADTDGTRLIGEEFTFCRKVQEAGYKVFNDYSTLTHHFVTVDTNLVNILAKQTHNNAVQKTYEALHNKIPDAENALDGLKGL